MSHNKKEPSMMESSLLVYLFIALFGLRPTQQDPAFVTYWF